MLGGERWKTISHAVGVPLVARKGRRFITYFLQQQAFGGEARKGTKSMSWSGGDRSKQHMHVSQLNYRPVPHLPGTLIVYINSPRTSSHSSAFSPVPIRTQVGRDL